MVENVNSLNLKMTATNNVLGTKQNASTAITTSNISKQTVSRAGKADTALCKRSNAWAKIVTTEGHDVSFWWTGSNLNVYVDGIYVGYMQINK